MAFPPYEETITALVERIESFVEKNPQILEMNCAFDLFQIKGFSVSDLSPSLAQASAALRIVKRKIGIHRVPIVSRIDSV